MEQIKPKFKVGDKVRIVKPDFNAIPSGWAIEIDFDPNRVCRVEKINLYAYRKEKCPSLPEDVRDGCSYYLSDVSDKTITFILPAIALELVESATEPYLQDPNVEPMSADKRIELYSYVLSRYGFDNQERMLMEEVGELFSALGKFHRNRIQIPDVITEIADVLIMTEQMAVIFGYEEVMKEKERKLERLANRSHFNQ